MPTSHNETRPALLETRAVRGNLLLRSDAVAFQFPVQGCAADAKHPASHYFVAIDLFENPLNGCALNGLQVGRRSLALSRVEQRISGRLRQHAGGKILDIDDFSVAQGGGPLDAIRKLADVARPVILQKTLHG